jgi:ABC-2 type transport system permease protein
MKKKGPGTVVRSTLRAVPAPVPAPFFLGPLIVRKLLRDLRLGLLVVGLLLFAFEFLWCKSTEQAVILTHKLLGRGIDMRVIFKVVFDQESGKMIEKLIGGDRITIGQGLDSLTIGYVHPLLLTILAVWAVGRVAGAIAGELDKGTMELLLAQPLARWRLIVSHLAVDCLTIPILCGCMWAGTTLGCYAFGLIDMTVDDRQPVDPRLFGPALFNIAALLFAIGGYTMAISSAGRSRARVLGIAVVLTLLQFLINLLGQTWQGVEFLRPWTIFYYYQPQALIMGFDRATEDGIRNILTLLAVGTVGYGAALVIFCRRDLPAPL